MRIQPTGRFLLLFQILGTLGNLFGIVAGITALQLHFPAVPQYIAIAAIVMGVLGMAGHWLVCAKGGVVAGLGVVCFFLITNTHDYGILGNGYIIGGLLWLAGTFHNLWHLKQAFLD